MPEVFDTEMFDGEAPAPVVPAGPVRFSSTLKIRCQPEVAELVDHIARSRGQKLAEYMRQALQAAIRREGYHLSPREPAESLREALREKDEMDALANELQRTTAFSRLSHIEMHVVFKKMAALGFVLDRERVG